MLRSTTTPNRTTVLKENLMRQPQPAPHTTAAEPHPLKVRSKLPREKSAHAARGFA
jgi:hypothetical protein